MNVDVPLFLRINEFARATGWLHGTVAAYADYGIVLFAALMLAGWWIALRTADPVVMGRAIWVPMGILLALAVNQLLAHRYPSPSFPSDHAVMAGAAAAGLFGIGRALGWLATLAALVMAFARVYLAVHHPHDVAAGLMVGAVISMLGYLAARRVLAWLVALAESTPLR
ncbi:MAG: phosphatase PAP2 family protein [Pseudonocardia sp.]|nr:phosphatase PAP2 family protein [Pseudonocardia sp.]MBO0875402.1 phosphatase PAP2 family protein [Pseudonocardia sp.]